MIISENEFNEKLSIEQIIEWAKEYNKQNGNYFYVEGNFLKWKNYKLCLTNNDYKSGYYILRTTFMTPDEWAAEAKAGRIKGVKYENGYFVY